MGSVGLVVANSTGDASGSDIEREVDKGAPSSALSAIPIEPVMSLVSFRAGSGVLNDAIGTGGGVAGPTI